MAAPAWLSTEQGMTAWTALLRPSKQLCVEALCTAAILQHQQACCHGIRCCQQGLDWVEMLQGLQVPVGPLAWPLMRLQPERFHFCTWDPTGRLWNIW